MNTIQLNATQRRRFRNVWNKRIVLWAASGSTDAQPIETADVDAIVNDPDRREHVDQESDGAFIMLDKHRERSNTIRIWTTGRGQIHIM